MHIKQFEIRFKFVFDRRPTRDAKKHFSMRKPNCLRFCNKNKHFMVLNYERETVRDYYVSELEKAR